jgi:flavin reductase (DIM6/NTAB) family NADH-FMN oxidoreductase RutF
MPAADASPRLALTLITGRSIILAREPCMPVDPEMLRAVMRHWPTGVAILTSRYGAQAHGMTVNSFTSVSLEPPLVLTCIEQVVRTHALVEHSRVFAVSILRDGQDWISDRFAGRDSENTDRFAGLKLTPRSPARLSWLTTSAIWIAR